LGKQLREGLLGAAGRVFEGLEGALEALLLDQCLAGLEAEVGEGRDRRPLPEELPGAGGAT
jgi:hypothetical protein